MPKIDEILDECFAYLSQTESIKKENTPEISKAYHTIWNIDTEISLYDKYYPIVFHMGFTDSVPYELPDVYCLDIDFGQIPHIGNDHKLCLYEDGISYDERQYCVLVHDVLRRAKQLIKEGLEGTNEADFQTEIISYWKHSYTSTKEFLEDDKYLIDFIPQETQELGFCYLYNSNKILFYAGENIPKNIDCNAIRVREGGNALYVSDFPIGEKPPYSITGKRLAEIVANSSDGKVIKRFINQSKSVSSILLFRLSINNTTALGGLEIKCSCKQCNRSGFRKGTLKKFDIITRFELQNRPICKMLVRLYNHNQIDMRTAGEKQKTYSFVVAGLGSIGSQLCHFLMSYSNAEFTLIDDDILSIDNVGRHLLGVRFMGDSKTNALTTYMKEYRPDMYILNCYNSLADYYSTETNLQDLRKVSAIFLCTGDIMAERNLIHKLAKNDVRKPIFILWLEPYAVAGHMIYLSPNDERQKDFYDLLTDSRTQLYRHNLINDEEYKNPERFVKQVAGCNGSYTNYSGNDVMLFLSNMFPNICKILENDCGNSSSCYRWIGNISNAKNIGFELKQGTYTKGDVQAM